MANPAEPLRGSRHRPVMRSRCGSRYRCAMRARAPRPSWPSIPCKPQHAKRSCNPGFTRSVCARRAPRCSSASRRRPPKIHNRPSFRRSPSRRCLSARSVHRRLRSVAWVACTLRPQQSAESSVGPVPHPTIAGWTGRRAFTCTRAMLRSSMTIRGGWIRSR